MDTQQSKLRDPQVIRVVQAVSRVITLFFIIALVLAIYQALVNDEPLPLWAWMGVVVLFAVAIGLAVAVVVYRSVAAQAGPFGFRPSSHVAGRLQSEALRVEADGANMLRADISMTAGALQLTGGAADADVLDATFTYDDADWKPPEVDYGVDGAGQGKLVVEQGSTRRPAMRPGRCEWVVRMNQDLRTDLNVNFGAGKGDLRLGGLALSRLRVESGVGQLDLDLSGEWGQSLEAFIKAGIGDVSLKLPQNVGVLVKSTVGFGSVHAQGLARDGKAYSNALYGQAGVTLSITVEGGLGKIYLA
jgi:hypothetical protein